MISCYEETQETQETQESGMTLIEVIIVIALLGTLMTVVLQSILPQQKEAEVKQTKIMLGKLSQDLLRFRLHTSRYPTTAEGLDALIVNPGLKRWQGPYASKERFEDVWGQKVEYDSDGRKFNLSSLGPPSDPQEIKLNDQDL